MKTRQKSRLRGSNVLDTNYNNEEIYKAIKKCLYNNKFRKIAFSTYNPYGIGNTGKKIINFMLKVKLDKKILQKKMTIKF